MRDRRGRSSGYALTVPNRPGLPGAALFARVCGPSFSLSMSTRLRSRLSTFALAAAVAGRVRLAGSRPLTNEGKRRGSASDHRAAEPPTKASARRASRSTAVGVPYRWGGESPSSGFDCSGLVRWAYGRVGIDLPHNSYALYSAGRTRVRESRLEPGDVLFFEGLGHVGLYLGRGRMVHAPQTGRDVEVVRSDGTNYGSRLIGARRVAASLSSSSSLARREEAPRRPAGRARACGVALRRRRRSSSPGSCRATTSPESRSTRTPSCDVERPPRFVSRGGEKLQHALDALGVDVDGTRLRGCRRLHGRLHRLPAPGRGGARDRDRRRLRPAASAAALRRARHRPRAHELAIADRAAVRAGARRLRRVVHQRDEGASARARARAAGLGGARARQAAVRGGSRAKSGRASCATRACNERCSKRSSKPRAAWGGVTVGVVDSGLPGPKGNREFFVHLVQPPGRIESR